MEIKQIIELRKDDIRFDVLDMILKAKDVQATFLMTRFHVGIIPPTDH